MSADLVIKGGTVVDGSGAPGLRADVAVAAGKIAAVGPDLARDIECERVLDASDHVVAPGFIDIHTHYDAQVFWDPSCTPSNFHGVTTVVAGNCGFSIAPTRPEHHEVIARTLENVEDMDVDTLAAGIPWDFVTFPEYLDSVERRGVGMNFTAYVGHTALRLFVMGDAAYERAATDDEVARMREALRDSLRAGAAGFATSFAITHRGVDGLPIPSRFAERSELNALLDVVRDEHRGVFAIAPGDPCHIDDLYDLQPRIGVPFTYGALLTGSDGSHRRGVQLNQDGWARGAEVWPQVSPRPLQFAMTMVSPFVLNINAEFAALMAGSLDDRRRAYADHHWRARALGVWTGRGFGVPDWTKYTIVESAKHPELVDRVIADVAAERGQPEFDTLLDLTLDEPDLGLRVLAVFRNDDSDEVAKLLVDDHCTLGLSDAGAHVGQLCDAPEPTDFLGNWVRDRALMPIETAVRKLTGIHADFLGLTDRGYLREGMCADVVVFDPDTVSPGPLRRVRDFPANAERLTADQPTGIRHVVVNGTPVQVDGAPAADGTRAGQVVRVPPRPA